MSTPSLNYAQEVHVAKTRTDLAYHTTISSALAAITDNAVGKRYAVKVAPGTYTEKVTCKNYIDLVADGGRAETIISFTATSNDEPTVTAAICTIKGFTITSDGNAGGFRARVVDAGAAAFRIEDCVLTATNSAAAATCFNATATCTIQDCEVDTAGGVATAALFATAAQTYVINETSLGGATNSASVTTTGTVTFTGCTCTNLLSQANGTVNIRRCRMEETALATVASTLNAEHSLFTAAMSTVAEALAHTISLSECNLGGQAITSNATAGTAITLHGCSNVGALTQAGTGAVTISKSSLGAVTNSSSAVMTMVDSALAALTQAAAAGTINVTNCSMTTISTGAAGTVRLNGGCLFTDISANAGVLTWKIDPNHIKVVAGTANMRIADALTLAAVGDVITIYPGTYAEFNLTLKASVDLVGTDPDQCVILTDGGANPILNAAVTCSISNLTVGNSNVGGTAITVTANILTMRNCYVYGTGIGDAIAMTGGQLNGYHSRVGAGDIDLSTAICQLEMYYCEITTDPINTAAGALDHVLWLEYCDLHGNSITSAATGAVSATIRGCTQIGSVTNAGTSVFTIQDSIVWAVSQTGAGSIAVQGGTLFAITRAVGSVTWRVNTNAWAVLPSGTTTDTVIGFAITASSAGAVILIYPGTYTESVTCKSGVNMRGVGSRGSAIITRVDADIITLNNCELDNLTVRLQTPTVAHYLVLDNGVAYTAKLTNLVLEITTPGNFAHQLFRFAAAGTYTIEHCYASIDFGVNNPVAVSILNTGVAATIRLFNNDFSMTSTGAFHIFASVAGTWSGGQNRWAGGCGMFNVALATVRFNADAVVCTAASAVASGSVTLKDGKQQYEVYAGMLVQHAITASAADTPAPAATAPYTVLIHPGIYAEVITCSTWVNLNGVGTKGSVVIQQTNANIITLATNVELDNLTVRLVTPLAARQLVLDNGVACTSKMKNLDLEITTPGGFTHTLFNFTGAGTYTLERCYCNITDGANPAAIVINNATAGATFRLFGNNFTYNSTGAFCIASSIAGTWTGGQNRWAGTCGLFSVTLGTITLSGDQVVCSATSTVAIAANVLLREGYTTYHVFPGMQIQHALTAGAGLEVIVHAGAYAPTADLTVSASTLVRGEGFATIITPTGAAIANGIVLGGDNITLRDMKVILAAGAGAALSRPNVVYATGRTLLWLENLWLVGDTTVGDDGSDSRQCGICFVTTTYSKIAKCRINTVKRSCILLITTSTHNTITGNTCSGATEAGIRLHSASVVSNDVTGNTCMSCSPGIYLYSSQQNNITGNMLVSNNSVGISVYSAALNNTVTGNTCISNASSGITVEQANRNTVTGNTCSLNTGRGIDILRSSYCTVTGNACHQNTLGGIRAFGDATANGDYNTITGNACTANTGNGVEVVGGVLANENIVVGNNLKNNTAAGLADSGTSSEVAHNIV